MDQQLYDEFGNYIGPELDELDDNRPIPGPAVPPPTLDQDQEPEESMVVETPMATGEASTAIILHEDKKYYPDASEVCAAVDVVCCANNYLAMTRYLRYYIGISRS